MANATKAQTQTQTQAHKKIDSNFKFGQVLEGV